MHLQNTRVISLISDSGRQRATAAAGDLWIGSGMTSTAIASGAATCSGGALHRSGSCSSKVVHFPNAGVITPGSTSMKVASGHPLAGQTVSQVLAIANRVLGGDVSVLPPGMSISALNDAMARINENFDNGTTNNGFLVP